MLMPRYGIHDGPRASSFAAPALQHSSPQHLTGASMHHASNRHNHDNITP